MNIATDTVVVQFLSNVQGLRKGLQDIRKEALKTDAALTKSSTEKRKADAAELAAQRRLTANQRAKTSAYEAEVKFLREIAELRKRDAALAAQMEMKASAQVGGFARARAAVGGQADPATRLRSETTFLNAKAGALRNVTAEVASANRHWRRHEKDLEDVSKQYSIVERRLGMFQRGFRRQTTTLMSGSMAFDIFQRRIDRASMAMWKFTIAAMPLRQVGMVLGGIAIGAGALIVNLAKQAAWLEVTRRQFQNMTGSISEANQKIEWLRDQAPKIVYTLQQVVESGRILESAGYDIQSLIYPMADLAAGLNQEGIDIVSATRAFVDGMHGEIRRLKNTFNLSQQDIIKFTRATTWEMFQQLAASERQSAILSAIQEKYPDANKAALESVMGTWVNFRDNLSRLAQELGKVIVEPLNKIVAAASAMVAWIKDLPAAFKGLAGVTILLAPVVTGAAALAAMISSAAIHTIGLYQAWRIYANTKKSDIAEILALEMKEEDLSAIRIAMLKAEEKENDALIAGLLRRYGLEQQINTSYASRLAMMRGQAGGAAGAAAGGVVAYPRAAAYDYSLSMGKFERSVSSASGSAWAFVSANAATIGALAAFAAGIYAIYKINKMQEDRVRTLADETRNASDELRELSIVVPAASRDVAKAAEDMADVFSGMSTRTGVFGRPTYGQMFGGEGGQLSAGQYRAIQEWALAVRQATDDELAKAVGRRNIDIARYEAMRILSTESATELETKRPQIILPEEIRKLGVAMARKRAMEQYNTLLDQGRLDEEAIAAAADQHVQKLQDQIQAEKELVRQGDEGALLRQRQLELELEKWNIAIKQGRDGRMLLHLYQSQWNEQKKQLDSLTGTDDLMQSLSKESDVNRALVEKTLSRYREAQSVLEAMLSTDEAIADVASTNADERERTIAALREQLSLLSDILSLMSEVATVGEQRRVATLFGAVGGAEHIGGAVTAGTYHAIAQRLREQASRTKDATDREDLIDLAYKNEERSLRAQKAWSDGILETRERIAGLSTDEVEQHRAMEQELQRQAQAAERYWRWQLAFLVVMGATETQIAEAQLDHESRIADLRKKANEESRAAIRIVYDRQIKALESQRDLAATVSGILASQTGLSSAMTEDKVEQARYELRIAELKERQAQADADASNDQVAANARLEAQYDLMRQIHQKRLEDQELELSVAEARLALAESMAEKEMATEQQVAAFRRAAAQEAYESIFQFRRGTLENIQATQKWFDIMYGSADKTKDKFKGIVDSIIGVPQELMGRFLSPASMMRVFGGETLASVMGGLKGVGPKPQIDVQGHFKIEILGLPENLVRLVDQKIQIGNQQFAMQLVPLMRSA